MTLAAKKIFILHGWTYSTEKWADFINEMKMRGFECILLKIPGLTETTDKVWALQDYVEWLKAKLDKENEISENNKVAATKQAAIVIGHSNGGRIALAFALKYSDKIKSLVLIDSAGIFHDELPIKIKRLLFGTAAKIGKKITSSEHLRNLMYKFARENDYKNASEQTRKTMANLISIDLAPKLSQINTPTIIIWGKNDKITPLADAFLINSSIKNSKLHIIEGAKHSPQFTHTKEIAEIISEQLKNI
jgi:pimeloyl-ACP methyl ester carboxylesterase